MIKIITGKGGVGKTTFASLYALTQSLNGVETKILSIDPMHSLSDSLGLRTYGITTDLNEIIANPQSLSNQQLSLQIRNYLNQFNKPEPLKENNWTDLWKLKPWSEHLKKIKEKPASLKIMNAQPTGRIIKKTTKGLLNSLYTEWEAIAGNEITKNNELLIIDTDCLEGLQRLLNYANENKEIKKQLLTKGEIIPVATTEHQTLNKINNLFMEELITDYQPVIKQLVINNAKTNDLSELKYYSQLKDVKNITILYQQKREPLGTDLLKLIKPDNTQSKQKEPEIITNQLPIADAYLICGKGGQGKTLIACSLAVRLAELGKTVYLMSADARSSLEDTLGEQIGFIKTGDAIKDLSATEQYQGLAIGVLKESPYWDEIPGVPLMKAMKRLNNNKDMTLIIDAPPSGTIKKSLDSGLTSESIIQRIIEELDLKQLLKRGKKGEHDFYLERKQAYNQGKELMSKDNFQSIIVTQPTKTALVETIKLEQTLRDYEINPYQLLENKTAHLIINKINNNNYSLAKEIIDYHYNDCLITTILEQSKEPIGRKKLSLIGRQLI